MAKINLQKIVAVKGETGLFHLVNYNPKGYFLQPFAGGPTKFIANEKSKVLAVGNVDLKLKNGSINSLEIFKKMSNVSVPRPNAGLNEIHSFFSKLFPDVDTSVAPSHMAKIVRWYHLISAKYGTQSMVNNEDDGLTIV